MLSFTINLIVLVGVSWRPGAPSGVAAAAAAAVPASDRQKSSFEGWTCQEQFGRLFF